MSPLYLASNLRILYAMQSRKLETWIMLKRKCIIMHVQISIKYWKLKNGLAYSDIYPGEGA